MLLAKQAKPGLILCDWNFMFHFKALIQVFSFYCDFTRAF
ncbi:hypothetical protein EMIT079MI2_110069 [Bacillus sp. IT-79MI2]